MEEVEIKTISDWAPKPEYVPEKKIPRPKPKPRPKGKPRVFRKPTARIQAAYAERQEALKNDENLKLPDLDDPWGNQAEAYFEAAQKAQPSHWRAFKPTKIQRELVMTAAGLGLPQDQIALLILDHKSGLPIHVETLAKIFKDELKIGIAKSNYYAMGNLFRHTFTAPAAAIFWAKARLKWRERDEEYSPPPPTRDSLSAVEVARRVAFVLNAAVLNVNLSPSGASVPRSEGTELTVIEQEPD